MTLDLIRLQLGILAGMGFIGGGAILRRDSLVLRVTTAATLWFVTLIGLCFGGGQISLGIAAFALGMFVLSGPRWFDYRMKQDQQGTLILTTERDQPAEEEIPAIVRKGGYKISIASVAYSGQTEQCRLEFNLQWREVPQNADTPPCIWTIAAGPACVGRSVEDLLTRSAKQIYHLDRCLKSPRIHVDEI